jgi:predicted AlkP superfamily phosphohydrolase/phosphomutase
MTMRKPADPRHGSLRDADAPRDLSRRAALKKLAAFAALAAVDITALASCGRRALAPLATERKVIILGLDGLDPRFVERWMGEGKLPNMSRLRELGGYSRLASSIPPQSPVAWATCITGRNPGGHGIFDFIQRDPQTYLPYLSIARTDPPGRTLSVGDWKLPLSGARVQCLRQGRAFWELLAERGVPCSAYRIPSNFPPQDTGAKELAGLGAPDLRGTYGEFSYYTDSPPKGARSISGGAVYRVTVSDGHVRARLTGPENTMRDGSPDTYADFDVWVDPRHRVAKIAVQGQEIVLRQGEWSDWLVVRFEMLPHLKSVAGICRFYLKEASPHLKLYVTPINVDPVDPALPVAAPGDFGRELAERFGRFYTMGFPEDVKALRHGILDDGEYLHQSGITVTEARRMYEGALDTFRRGLLFYYFSVTDRTQHMFWRAMDPRHPAHDPRSAREFGSAIEDCYRQADQFVGQAMEACDRDTTLMVMSDHGFSPYYRAFDLNAWLAANGYLVGKEPWAGGADILSNANWSETTAYGLGFNSLYLNLRGREAEGRLDPMEREAVSRRLARQLEQARDPRTGERMIARVYLGHEVYSGDLTDRAPDLVVGYARGYRCSDDSVLGEVSAHLVQDNMDKWSGDHCVDRALVPGVLFANKPIRASAPGLPDVAASALAEFDAPAPGDMEGKPVW